VAYNWPAALCPPPNHPPVSFRGGVPYGRAADVALIEISRFSADYKELLQILRIFASKYY
ncbi:MAG: hypothetical protein K2L33_02420, partial [Muribaculaceae bacterium]|nr:hypothetical protein [Muribaculaceae bacterium]